MNDALLELSHVVMLAGVGWVAWGQRKILKRGLDHPIVEHVAALNAEAQQAMRTMLHAELQLFSERIRTEIRSELELVRVRLEALEQWKREQGGG